MSTTDVRSDRASARSSDLKLEVITIPVADVDRAKVFYGETLGWRLDAAFSDPDGNTWLPQEITTRLPGRNETAAEQSGDELPT